jgi:hypothetical protein
MITKDKERNGVPIADSVYDKNTTKLSFRGYKTTKQVYLLKPVYYAKTT